jgi:chromosome segregation ATPase
MDKKTIVETRNRIKHYLQKLNQEIQDLAQQIETKKHYIELLNHQLVILDEYASSQQYKTQYEDINQKYQKERERLEKLFRKYASTETESEKLRNEIKQWHDWYDYNKQIFDRLFNAPPRGQTPKSTINKPPLSKTRNKRRKPTSTRTR